MCRVPLPIVTLSSRSKGDESGMDATTKAAMASRRRSVSRVSVVDQVCSSIKQDIADGIWKEGEKLPSEGEFAELFGVNRLSVRMALQKLSTLGIVETRVGEGSFVRSFSLKPIFEEVALFYDEEKLAEVRQLRYLLESDSLRIAVRSASEEEKTLLKEAQDHYDEMAVDFFADINDEERLHALVEADFMFHCCIIQMSHNSLYEDIYHMVGLLIRGHIKQLMRKRINARVALGLPAVVPNDGHYRMYEAIVNANVETTQQLCEEMLAISPAKGLDIFD